jgi:hypothetical protein
MQAREWPDEERELHRGLRLLKQRRDRVGRALRHQRQPAAQRLVRVEGGERAVLRAARKQRERTQVRGRADARGEQHAERLDGEEEGEGEERGRWREHQRARVHPLPRAPRRQRDQQRDGDERAARRRPQRAQQLRQVPGGLDELHGGVDVERGAEAAQVDRQLRREVRTRPRARVRHVVAVERHERSRDRRDRHDRAGDGADGIGEDGAGDLARGEVDCRTLPVVREVAVHDAQQDSVLHVRRVNVVAVERRDCRDEPELRPEEVEGRGSEADEGDARE